MDKEGGGPVADANHLLTGKELMAKLMSDKFKE